MISNKRRKSPPLDIKIGSPEEVLWTNVLREAKILLKQSEDNSIIQRSIIALAEEKIAFEQEKFK